ncbi:MAG: hypothetical protein CMJ64_05245 [Planctomycetaceae bacterium]|nr:hypothetical protein [Planctomycetaceae bacterium]
MATLRKPRILNIMRISSLLHNWFGDSYAVDGEGLETTFEHAWPLPTWITLLAVAFVVAVVLAIYHYERRGRKPMRAAMTALRLAMFAVALFMLYGWVQHQHRTELPELVIVVDGSQSMGFEDTYQSNRMRSAIQRRVGDSAVGTTRLALAKAILGDEEQGWLARLEAAYQVKLFRIGTAIRRMDDHASGVTSIEPDDEASRIGEGLLEILKSQRGLSTAAVVLLTDGVNTTGPAISEAAEYARARSIPLHIVGLGSELPPKDIWINGLLSEDDVFVGDLLTFDLQLHNQGFVPRTVSVRLTSDSRVLDEQDIALPASEQALPVRLAYRPEAEGEFEHTIEVVPLEEEANIDNNRLTRKVVVRNATVRVLFVQSRPSYEYRFLKSLLSRSVQHKAGQGRGVELTTVLQEADVQPSAQDAGGTNLFPVRREELFSYDVLIIGDADPSFFTNTSLQHISDFVTERGGGVIFVAGPMYMPQAYRDTPLANLFPFDAATSRQPLSESLRSDGDVVQLTALGKEVSFVQLGDDATQSTGIWSQLPPLRWFLETPDLKPAAIVLAQHPTRKLLDGTPVPVITMQFAGAGKVLFHATDETYLWSRGREADKLYARYWAQAIRYLSHAKLNADQAPIEIETDSPQYLEGEAVHIRVRFRDDRLAPPLGEGVIVAVEDEKGKRTSVTLEQRESARGEFETRLSGLEAGSYQAWLAAPTIEDGSAPLQFTVDSSNSELAVLRMNATELKAAARTTRGRFYTFDTASRLPNRLPRGKEVRIESLPPTPIWNSPWVAVIFVSLLAAEWTLRKRAGLL